MLSVNLEPIRIDDPPPERINWMSDSIISEAMSRCVTSPQVVIFGSRPPSKRKTIKAAIHSWRPQAAISRCDQPTVATRGKTLWRPSLELLSSLASIFGVSEILASHDHERWYHHACGRDKPKTHGRIVSVKVTRCTFILVKILSVCLSRSR